MSNNDPSECNSIHQAGFKSQLIPKAGLQNKSPQIPSSTEIQPARDYRRKQNAIPFGKLADNPYLPRFVQTSITFA